jgi:hypothetical protein
MILLIWAVKTAILQLANAELPAIRPAIIRMGKRGRTSAVTLSAEFCLLKLIVVNKPQHKLAHLVHLFALNECN